MSFMSSAAAAGACAGAGATLLDLKRGGCVLNPKIAPPTVKIPKAAAGSRAGTNPINAPAGVQPLQPFQPTFSTPGSFDNLLNFTSLFSKSSSASSSFAPFWNSGAGGYSNRNLHPILSDQDPHTFARSPAKWN